MSFVDLKSGSPETRQGVLTLNAENVVETAPLDPERLDWMLRHSALALARPDGRAFVICFGPGAPYDSQNYTWFSNRYDDFLYVDRIVVGRELRGAGVGRALYRSVLADAEARAVPVVCEINKVPPNPGSDAFHAALGFSVIGEAETAPGRRVRYLSRATG